MTIAEWIAARREGLTATKTVHPDIDVVAIEIDTFDQMLDVIEAANNLYECRTEVVMDREGDLWDALEALTGEES